MHQHIREIRIGNGNSLAFTNSVVRFSVGAIPRSRNLTIDARWLSLKSEIATIRPLIIRAERPTNRLRPTPAKRAHRLEPFVRQQLVHTSLVTGFCRRESTDHDVIPVRVSEGKLHGPCVQTHARLF